MRYEENQCVSCDLPCIGDGCSYRHVICYDCDICGDQAEFHVDGEDMCPVCAKKYIYDALDDMSIDEIAEKLNIEFSRID